MRLSRTQKAIQSEELPHAITALVRRADGTVDTLVDEDGLTTALGSDAGMLWVDLDVADPAQARILKDVFHFHPLAIEDALNPSSRVKVDEYPTFLVVIARVVAFVESTADPYDLETTNLTVFVTKNAVVTAHRECVPAVDTLIAGLKGNTDLLARGPGRVAHYILDSAVDAYFPVLDRLDEFVDELEERVFGQFDEEVLQEIFRVKRLVITLRRYLAPQREVLSELTMRPSTFLSTDAQLYFRDVYDHMLRITDSLDNYRDLLSSTLDAYLTQVSNRLGLVSKGLALVGALSVPFVVVAGVYGMNFEHIPLQHHPYGFEIMVAIQAVIALVFLAVLRWRKML
ncbi:MAG: magnesium transporter CorA family protein [Gemmatimonadaceae bacterium]